MSILKSHEHGWIISHLEFINEIYNEVLYKDKICKLKFKDEIFDINSQYIRQNKIKKTLNNQEVLVSNKKVKNKKRNNLMPDNLEDIKFVSENYRDIISDEFVEKSLTDHNEKARNASIEFYSNSLQNKFNEFYGCNKLNTVINTFDENEYVFPKNSTFYSYDIKDIDKKMKLCNQFDFILMDPPWLNKFIKRNRNKSYNSMTNESLSEIPIDNLLKTGGIIAIWCTNNPTHYNYIINVMFPKWKINYLAKWFWLKITKSGEPVCDFTYQLSGKQPFELIIFGGFEINSLPVLPEKKLVISVPSAIHSHKPPLVELMKPYLPEDPNCLEIFARYLLPNWTSWGLEVLKLQTLNLYDIHNASENNLSIN